MTGDLLQRTRTRLTGGRPTGPRRRGAVLIEAALVILVLLMLTLGGIEYGYFIWMKHTLTGAARTGARAAILAGASNTAIETKVKDSLTATGLDGTAATVTITDAAGGAITLSTAAPDTDVKVHVQMNSVSIVGGMVPGVPSTVTAAVVMRKEAT